ncbi:short-chain dehydrogenase [Alsobacter soli]|uniref:Short-chain dehydrogenase n=1 Tax=Alsobacter soli TaxID=2109933 RepID=A0A2T1HVC5_9HYPH|nr:SDR family oxidoreductase [Alsobacter soli]PSC05594.1 short-chain dehydrogenase [Alsobacter soli]
MQADASGVFAGRELEGRVALVTGAARNIGRAIALGLGRGGASVLVAAHASRDAAEETAALVRADGGAAEVALADVADPAGAQALVDAALRAFGRLDILVCNAAARSDGAIESITPQEWRRITSSILDGTFFCAQAAGPHLRASGQGALVTLGGVAAHVGLSGRAHVSAAKAGVLGLTRALAREWAPHVTANCVSPGYVATARAGEVPAHFRERAPLAGRPGAPEEIAAAVRYLAGPAARFVTGQTLHLNGGWHMGA